MDTEHSCSCCLVRQPVMDLKIPYTRFGKTEIYADMFKECFEIHLELSANVCGICEVCAGRLRDASDFKLQVLCSQAKLRERIEGALDIKEEEPLVKAELPDCVSVRDEESILHELQLGASEDPLPTDGSDVFMEFVMNFENHVSSLWKQEPKIDFASISEPAQRSRDPHTEGFVQSRLRKEPPSLKKDHLDNTCETCGKHFVLKTELAHHKQLHQRYNCTICDKPFEFKSQLDIHNRHNHAGDKPYQCEICNKKYASKCAMYKHRKTHFEKRFRCEECDKLFSNELKLNTHKRIHSVKIPCKYKCDMCDAEFKIKRTLLAHIGRHAGMMNFPCDLCTMKFWDYSGMLDHKRIHSGDRKSYSCEVCHKAFTIKSKLITHSKTHLDQKYPCEFCPAQLANSRSLEQHKLIHTGERRYPCNYCNKQFRYKHNLMAHIPIHTGEKPYCCEICGKQFARRDNLKTHLATHAEGVRYQCELCTKSYPTKEGLRQHKRTHTKNKVTKPRVSEMANEIKYIGNIVP